MHPDELFYKALGLAHPLEEENTQIPLGKVDTKKSPEVLAVIVEQHNEKIRAEFNSTEHDLTDEEVKAYIVRFIPSFEQYLRFIPLWKSGFKQMKDIKTLEEERAYLSNTAQGDGGAQYYKEMDWLAKNTDSLKRNPDKDDILKDISKGLSRGERLQSITMDLYLKEASYYAYTSPLLRGFVESYLPENYTPDLNGYLDYLATNHASIYEQINRSDLVGANLKEADRRRHTYVVGGSGAGKSELLKFIAWRYIEQHRDDASCIYLDPHGDAVEELAQLPHWKEHPEDLLYINPALKGGHTFRINPLQPPPNSTPQEREVIAQQLVGAFEELLKGGAGGTLSVNMRALLMPCIVVLLDDGNKTLIDLQNFMREDTNDPYIKMGQASKRPAIAYFFEHDFDSKDYATTKRSLIIKLQSLFNSEFFYNIVNGPTTIDLDKAINEKKAILVNLAKGEVGPDVSEAVGRFLIAALQGLAMRRQKIDKSKRVPVHLIIDECQNYIGESTTTILEEARKYGLHLTLGQQVVGRGMSHDMKIVVLNNTAIKMVGRTPEDARLAKLMGISYEDLQQLNVGQFYCRCGNSPTFLFKSDALLGDKWCMSPEDFDKLKEQQLENVYVKVGETEHLNPSKEGRELI